MFVSFDFPLLSALRTKIQLAGSAHEFGGGSERCTQAPPLTQSDIHCESGRACGVHPNYNKPFYEHVDPDFLRRSVSRLLLTTEQFLHLNHD